MSICTYLAHMHGSVRSGTYCVYSNTYHYVPNLNYVPIRTSFICDNTYQYVSATKYIPIRTVVYIPICTKIHTNLEILEIRTPDWPNYVPHFVICTTMHRNSCWCWLSISALNGRTSIVRLTLEGHPLVFPRPLTPLASSFRLLTATNLPLHAACAASPPLGLSSDY